jgi:hypothetical protein
VTGGVGRKNCAQLTRPELQPTGTISLIARGRRGAMREEDDANYRRRISDVLVRHGFGWVVTQAEAQIAEGKPSSKQVSERESFPVLADGIFAVRRPRSRRASLITSEPYTESERLEILLQAIEAAIVQRSMMEQELLLQFADISSIRFEPDSPLEITEDTHFGVPHALDTEREGGAIELEIEARAALSNMKGR